MEETGFSRGAGKGGSRAARGLHKQVANSEEVVMRLGTIAIGAILVTGMGTSGVAQQRGNNDILVTLRNAGNFTWFLRAVDGAKLTQQLKTGEYTVFAPTDDAFGRIPGTRRDSLLRDPVALEALIRNHIVEGRLTASEAGSGARGMSFLGGGAIKADHNGSYIRVNGAQIIKALVPMSEMLEYDRHLRAMTQGRSSFHMEFSHYEEVPRPVQEKIVAQAKKHQEEEHE